VTQDASARKSVLSELRARYNRGLWQLPPKAHSHLNGSSRVYFLPDIDIPILNLNLNLYVFPNYLEDIVATFLLFTLLVMDRLANKVNLLVLRRSS
jgi:hypothetical protein